MLKINGEKVSNKDAVEDVRFQGPGRQFDKLHSYQSGKIALYTHDSDEGPDGYGGNTGAIS